MVDKYIFVKEEIKNDIDVLDLLEYYNAKISTVKNRKARSNCVIHGGRGMYNFSFGLDDKLWTCYSRHCGEDVTSKARDIFLFIKLAEEARGARCEFKKCLQIASNICRTPINIDDFKYNKEERDKVEIQRWVNRMQEKESKNAELDESLIELYMSQYSSYIETRGYEKDYLKYFEIGFSKDGINENIISPKFPGRIIVPIRDEEGKLVGLSGRLATDSKILINRYGKYKHLIDFNKGLVLYNYHNAANSIRENKKIILCEGFFDVMRLNSFGIDNSVALMGTSLTPQQFMICLDATDVYICLDNDKAGKVSSIRIAEQLKKYMNVYIVNLKGKDPDKIEDPIEFWEAIGNSERYINK